MEAENQNQQDQQKQGDTPFVGINGETTGLGFSQRDQHGQKEEEQGVIEFKVISNDGTHTNMHRLIDLKNIFSRQLPKMPKEYIVKLVFDRSHEAMVILKNDKKVIGGICYRQYPSQQFAEVAFLAVTATEQVKGYGTRLMNKYKEYMQSKQIEFLLTYADNFAIGYFKKQGFTKEPRMPTERWKGFIKDYDGGTLMECYIHPFLDYSNVSNLIKKQREHTADQIKKLCMNHKKFEGINLDDYKNTNIKDDQPYADPEQIPGIAESGWHWDDFNELKKQKERSFNLMCQNIIKNMRDQKSAWPFNEPVNRDDVADYYEVIQDPIDLKTIEKKLQANLYQDKETFINDVTRMFKNCRQYNQADTIYYKCADELEKYIQPYLDNLKESNVGVALTTRSGLSKTSKKIKKHVKN